MGAEVLWFFVAPAFYTFVLIISFTRWKPALRRAGKILKLTGQVVHEEKGLIVPAVLKVFLIGVLTSFLGIIDLYIMTCIYSLDNPISIKSSFALSIVQSLPSGGNLYFSLIYLVLTIGLL